MILISQDTTPHSRLGNSLVWMTRLYNFLKKYDQKVVFPWGLENFYKYLGAESFYTQKSDNLENYFLQTFGQLLTAQNLQSIARLIEHSYERENQLEAFGWSHINIEIKDKNILFLSGNVDILNEKLASSFSDYKLVIIHEPYRLISQLEGYESDIDCIAPDEKLYLEQSAFVKSFSQKSVGLHIRNGDYKHWQNGKYFFDSDFWLEKAKFYKKDGYLVWVFSNELDPILENTLLESGVKISNEAFEIDFVRLMMMDKIIAPPSTFSGMAYRISKDYFKNNIELITLNPKH